MTVPDSRPVESLFAPDGLILDEYRMTLFQRRLSSFEILGCEHVETAMQFACILWEQLALKQWPDVVLRRGGVCGGILRERFLT
jgi:hypothetical protein